MNLNRALVFIVGILIGHAFTLYQSSTTDKQDEKNKCSVHTSKKEINEIDVSGAQIKGAE